MFSRLDLRQARIILTGASSGIGSALARQLAVCRPRLVLASRDEKRLESLASEVTALGGEAHVVPTDVTDPGQRSRLITDAVGRLGGLDILMNNAGVGAMGFFTESSEDLLRRIFEVNFFACTELTRLAIPHLRQGKNAMLVNIASVLGRRAVPGCTEYCASKFALAGWSEGLRPELKQQGIHVLLVCPGVIETSFRAHLLEDRVRFGWQNHRSMTAQRCARLIVRAVQRRRNELVTTAEGVGLLWLNRLAPRLIDFFLARYARPLEKG